MPAKRRHDRRHQQQHRQRVLQASCRATHSGIGNERLELPRKRPRLRLCRRQSRQGVRPKYATTASTTLTHHGSNANRPSRPPPEDLFFLLAILALSLKTSAEYRGRIVCTAAGVHGELPKRYQLPSSPGRIARTRASEQQRDFASTVLGGTLLIAMSDRHRNCRRTALHASRRCGVLRIEIPNQASDFQLSTPP